MNHKNLSVKQRYTLFFVILFCLFIVSTALLRTWNRTPEAHFTDGVWFMEEDQPQNALKHFLIAQKSNDPLIKKISSLYLGHIYQQGPNEMPVDIKKAVFYYEQAVTLGSIEALYTLALLYDAGTKVPENREKAKEYMTKAAEVMPEAQYALAVWTERGYFGKPDLGKAVVLYKKAANAGVENAIKSLISIYHGGFGGFPQNIKKEQYWRAKLK